MRAGCRWTYFSDYRQLRAGSRMTIDEGMQHANPRRLTHGGCDPRDDHVRIMNMHSSGNNHHSMINEALLRGMINILTMQTTSRTAMLDRRELLRLVAGVGAAM